MESQGRIKDITVDFLTKQTLLTLAIERKPSEIEAECLRLREKNLDILIKEHREKRSLNANGYFHALVGKIADKIGRSKTYVKNDLITSYGQQLFIDGDKVSIKTQITPEVMMETETLHCLKIGQKEENEKTLYFYDVYRGSHTYDTMEMSKLIDGTVQEAKEYGIETMTPNQLEELKQRWKVDIDAPPI